MAITSPGVLCLVMPFLLCSGKLDDGGFRFPGRRLGTFDPALLLVEGPQRLLINLEGLG